MRVILLQDVRGFGKKGEVRETSDGYAKNVLIAKGLATLATPREIQRLNEQKAAKEKSIAKERALFLKIKEELKEKELLFPVKTGTKGEVFGSITAEMIKNALREQGIEANKINLPKALKALGSYDVEVMLGMGITGTVKVKLLSQK